MTKSVVDLRSFENRLVRWATKDYSFNEVRSRIDMIESVLKNVSKVEFDPEEGYTLSFYAGTDVSVAMKAGWYCTLVLTSDISPSLHVKTNFNGIVMTWGFS